MADPGAPDLIENGYVVGFMTEAQFRSMREFQTYQNRSGVPDTKADVKTRANAAYPRSVLEVLVQINEILAGRIAVPGIAGIAGKSWRPGDDGSDLVELLDIGSYGIQSPSHMWLLDASYSALIGGTNMVSSDPTKDEFMLVNARGGVALEARFIRAVRSMYGTRYHSFANLSGIGQTMTFAAFITLSEWNQSPDGIVLAAHRAYDRATETGASYRLGFEIGLGYASVLETADSLVLYYRHRNASDDEVVRYVVVGSAGHLSIPFGREVFLAFKRTATTLDFYLNGLLLYSTTFSAPDAPSPGTAAEMRLLLGGDWDASRYLNGGFRNVAVWTGVQPTAANLENYYRIGAGFLPKALPA